METPMPNPVKLDAATLRELQSILERHQRATPGEWKAFGCAVQMTSPKGYCRGLYVVCSAINGREQAARDDAAFIASAHQDVPRLLEIIERLQSETA